MAVDPKRRKEKNEKDLAYLNKGKMAERLKALVC
jgi:hypothetical protein